MSHAYVLSAAMIRMGKYPQASYAGLAVPAVLAAIRDSGLSVRDIQAVVCGHAFGGMLTGQRIIKDIGLGTVPVINVDNACSGGATAIHLAQTAIRNGEHDVVLVIGVDKLTQFGGGTLPLVQEDIEVQQGMVMPALYAMRARRYMHERNATVADLAQVSVKARRHGALNPYAQLRKEVSLQAVLESKPIADPLTLFQCCPTGDGAAALLVVSDKILKRVNKTALKIRASILHSGQYSGGYRDMLTPEITYQSARDAYEQAQLGAAELDMVELHDAFSIAELVYYEALGLCATGESLSLLHSNRTSLHRNQGGSAVVNPSGGLLAKGHPVGASGVAQVAEAYWQLTEQAGARQISNARLALTHVTGGGIAGFDHGACAIHIFERVN